ncbi:MAG: class B sortase, partial [Clostridiales bacterium]|nr:class B sortase [Clostridiales bacterium]
NTVIYGHNMRNKTMFATLHNFEDSAFFDEYPYVYIYTGDSALVYEVFAAYSTDNSHVIASNDFSTEEGRQEYLDKLATLSEGKGNFRDVELSTQSHILTLSTCIGNSSKRYLVQAVLIGEGNRG